MLVRTYRLTDKFGTALLKSLLLLTDTLLQGMQSITRVIGRLFALVFGVLFALLYGVFSVVRNILRRLVWIVAGLFRMLFSVVGRGGSVTARAVRRSSTRVVSSTSSVAADAMARRAAQAEMRAAVTEDPLRVQNRVLSLVTVALLAVLIGVVLWATNPARTGGGLPENGTNPLNGSALLLAGTLNPTSAPLLSTPVPTATTLPSVLEARGSIAYTARENGQDDLWALGIGTRTPLRLTNSPGDERDPAWSPDGRRLAYASNQDGNWEVYIYDLGSGQTTRMTYDLSFQGGPGWSPDGQWLVYESYQGGNLDVYVVPVDGSQPAQRVTENEAPDFSPVWSPDGRRIAFVSWRDGNQDIYLFSLDNPSDSAVVNVTNTPTRQENRPSWSPDGKLLAYSAVDEGLEKVFVKSTENIQAAAQVLERGAAPAWSPDGASLIYTLESLEGTQLVAGPFSETGVSTLVVGVPQHATHPTWTGTPLPAALVSSGGLPSGTPQASYVEQVAPADADGLFRLGQLLNVEVARSTPYLSDKVNDSFNALRERTLDRVGWDFLGELDDAFWNIDRPPQPGEERRNWYMTGRAFGATRNLIAGFPAGIEMVREDLGVETYWRLYVRVPDEAQAGQLGEPLRSMPWDVLSRNAGDVQAYDQGGRLKTTIPGGYYVDFTQLAEDYGWLRAAAGGDWRANANSMNYWLFEKTEGLDWYLAMRQLYTDAQLGGFAPTAVPQPTLAP
jgi:TolB protein